MDVAASIDYEVYGESIEVAFMLRSISIFKNLSITVISDSSWTWALACLQVGVGKIICTPRTREAEENLSCICHSGLPLLGNLEVEAVSDTKRVAQGIVLVECRNIQSLCQLSLDDASHLVVVGSAEVRHAIGDTADRMFSKHRLTHRTLGGLSVAAVEFWWKGRNEFMVKLMSLKYPKRPVNKFLNLATALPMGPEARDLRKTSSWWTASSNKPFGWPFPTWPVVIESPSVFLKGASVTRHLAVKEACQLLDVPGIWPKEVVCDMWSWNQGQVLPLRLQVEFLLRAANWFSADVVQNPIQTLQPLTERRTDPSSLLLHTDQMKQIGDTALFRLSYFRWVWEPQFGKQVSVASKADDAAIDTSIWAVGGDGPGLEVSRERLRRFLHRVWYANLRQEATNFLQGQKEIAPGADYNKDVQAVQDCLLRAKRSSWWEWNDGSRLFFWRWPQCWRLEARDGARAFHHHWPKRRPMARVVNVESQWMKDSHDEKIEKLINRRYIRQISDTSKIHVSIPHFPVLKTESDTRAVWSDTENGVNLSIYVPRMFLPTARTMHRRLPPGGWMADMDGGEMFNNFMMHPSEQPLAGVNVSKKLQEKLGCPALMCWDRLLFGWRPAPLFASRMFLRAIEISKGRPDIQTSAFQWSNVRLNLPSSETYDPGARWVAKIRSDGLEASDEVTFVDDVRPIGATEPLATKATRQLASGVQRLGSQDATRKRRRAKQRAGAWAGHVAYTDCGLDREFVTQEKWDRAKESIQWMLDLLEAGEPFPYPEFISKRGFLVHVTVTYQHLKPYMKGVHLTANSWRINRDSDGWPSCPTSDEDELEEEEEADFEDRVMWHLAEEQLGRTPSWSEDIARDGDESKVKFVDPVPRLRQDLEAMAQFLSLDTPVMIVLRPVRGVYNLAYGFVDASGEGFGGTLRGQPGPFQDQLRSARLGFWCSEISERSSNYREFRNLVEHIRQEAKLGRLAGLEVWIYTDNQVTESVWYNGTTTERSLFELILDLRQQAIEGNFVLHVVHVAGTRLIGEGTDGLSRGEVMVSALLDAFAHSVPLDKMSLQRVPKLREWFDEWLDTGYKVATPENWMWQAGSLWDYSYPVKLQTWVWDLPPAAAPYVLEELALARMKRHETLRGIVVLPRLMKPYWLRRFVKTVDVFFVVPAGCSVWPKENHEPLFVGLFLPLLHCRPWDWRKVPFLVGLGRTLSALYATDNPTAGTLLREFWSAALWIQNMPELLVSGMLSDPGFHRFLGVARTRSSNGSSGH
jgi:hypothetical protein